MPQRPGEGKYVRGQRSGRRTRGESGVDRVGTGDREAVELFVVVGEYEGLRG